jgi:glycosyltransferase involved in cell wall biosynthesis
VTIDGKVVMSLGDTGKVPQAEVYIVQRRLTDYRVPLFEQLREELGRIGVKLHVVHGQPAPNEVSKCDTGEMPWAEQITNLYWRVGGKYLCWQPLLEDFRRADLIITTQENSMLSNYALLFKRKYGQPKIAFWGHGANLQSRSPNGIRERFKRWTSRQVDWWFAYSPLSTELIRLSGFPLERITNLENAIDTDGIRAAMAKVERREVAATRAELGWEEGRVGLFLGSLHADKRLEFLLQAVDYLHEMDSLFHLLIVGDGPLRNVVEKYCASRPWCVWVGAQKGRKKALYLAMADVLLNPGAVGLGILDSFAAGVPMVTTDCRLHGPEFAYLRHGENGEVTGNSLDAYAAGVQRVLNDDAYRIRLREGCRSSAETYTIENMEQNFREGILAALSADKLV